MDLPQDFIPATEWQIVTPETRRTYFYPAIRAAQAHLRRLPKNAPRSVRSMFTAETRMRWLRMAEPWDYMAAVDCARADWDAFLRNGGGNVA